MRSLMMLPLMLIAGAATAQVGATVNGALGGTAGAGGTLAVGGLPDVAGTATDTVRGAADATRDTVTRTETGTRGAVGESVHVEAGASVRVARGTRCWYEPERYYDPVYRDGYYYCERTGPGAAVGAGASVKR